MTETGDLSENPKHVFRFLLAKRMLGGAARISLASERFLGDPPLVESTLENLVK